MRFQYQALHEDGRAVAGVIEAASERLAYRDLQKRGVRPTSIVETAPRPGKGPWPRWRSVEGNYIAALKQLSTLVEGGVPVAEAATALAEATDQPALSAAYAQLNAGLRRGETFPSAFARCFPDVPEYVHGMVAAGDLSGRLAEALADAAAETEHTAKIRSELRHALVYPAFLVVFGALAVLFIFAVVVPRFAAMFRGRFDQLPLLSYLVISFGMWFRENMLVALLVLAAAGLCVAYGVRRQSRATVLDMLSGVPLVRSWLREIEIGRWAAVLARLLENRVPLVQGLGLARGALRGSTTLARLTQAEREVRSGTTLAAALDNSAFLTGQALTLIRVGERSGNLAGMVRSIAAMYEEAVRNRTRVALAIVEPLAIVLIGGVIGLIATAIFLAITSINKVPGL